MPYTVDQLLSLVDSFAEIATNSLIKTAAKKVEEDKKAPKGKKKFPFWLMKKKPKVEDSSDSSKSKPSKKEDAKNVDKKKVKKSAHYNAILNKYSQYQNPLDDLKSSLHSFKAFVHGLRNDPQAGDILKNMINTTNPKILDNVSHYIDIAVGENDINAIKNNFELVLSELNPFINKCSRSGIRNQIDDKITNIMNNIFKILTNQYESNTGSKDPKILTKYTENPPGTTPYDSIAPSKPAETIAKPGVMRAGGDPKVFSAQEVLHYGGYTGTDGNLIKADGFLGPNTKKALDDYSNHHNISSVSYIDLCNMIDVARKAARKAAQPDYTPLPPNPY